MLEKIEDINLLNLAKDIKEMISDGKLKIKTDDYQVELEVNNDFKELMVHENFLMTELYFENKDDFKKCFNEEYSSKLNEIFHSVRVKEIKVQGEDSYMGTLIYHEIFGEKMIFKLAFIRYLRRFQREEHWK